MSIGVTAFGSIFSGTTEYSLSIPVPTGVGTTTDLVFLNTAAVSYSTYPVLSTAKTMLSSLLWIVFGLWVLQTINGILHVSPKRDPIVINR